MNEAFITLTIPVKKSIALIAHDSKKHELIEWCRANKDILAKHDLCGTGTTARMITDQTGLSVKGYNSGPLGGDAQIADLVLERRCQRAVFFEDPHVARQHEADIQLLERAVTTVTDTAVCITSPAVASRWVAAARRRAQLRAG